MFHTCTNKWTMWIHKRYSLTLHVGTHEGTSTVIVFQEWNARSRYRNDLTWRYVGVVNLATVNHHSFTLDTSDNLITDKMSILNLICLCNYVIIFFIRRHVLDFISNLAIHNLTVWGFDKSIFIYLRISCKVRNQTDVWSFRCLDWTDTSIVRVVNITHFEASTFTCKTTRS